MTSRRKILISTIIALGYFILSLVYFFGGLHDPITESTFREGIENLICLPAIIIFGVGFSEGGYAAYLTGAIIFSLIWLVITGLTFLSIGLIKTRTHNNK